MERKRVKINRTTMYMLPLITSNAYINYIRAYIGIDRFTDIDGTIYLKQIEDNENIEHILPTISGYQGKTYIKSNPIYIFKIPKEYEKDYEQFILGNYTKISKFAKNVILRFWNIRGYSDIKDKALQVLFGDDIRFQVMKVDELIDFDNVKLREETLKLVQEVGEIDDIIKLKDELIFSN